MAVFRNVIAQFWNGPRVVQRLGPALTVEQWAVLTDAEVLTLLHEVGATAIPDTAEGRRARLAGYPTQADLDVIATNTTGLNGGVRPSVRVLELMPSLRATGTGWDHGPAGCVRHG